MPKRNPDRGSPGKIALWLVIELAIYSVFVVAYYFLVLLFLRDWFKQLFDTHRILYAALVLPLIIGQAVLLELVTMVLSKLGLGRQEKKP